MTKDKGLMDEIINFVKQERTAWDTGTVYITEKVAFNMRDLIRQCRKNYWGVFDNPTDPVTGRKKVWIPLTESAVESVVKNVDLDTRDINFRAKKRPSIGLTHVIRSAVKNNLDDIFFGEYLDEMERIASIDGTCVWKTIEKKEKNKKTFDIRTVDLLNFYIDPSARSIAETPAVLERAVLPTNELKSYDGWINTDLLEGTEDLHPTDNEALGKTTQRGKTKFTDVWEHWGLIPKYFITGNKKDTEQIEGHLVVSGIDSNAALFHLAEKNEKGVKPYEEFWRRRVPGRWHGRGDAEMLLMLQLWINIIVNLRINRNYVESMGLYKMRKGSGITAQMLSRLASNGIIQVSQLDDIEPMVLQAASQQNYNDEEIAKNWGDRITQAFEAITGEALPSSTTATVGAIQSRSAMSGMSLVKEGYGMSLQRWLKRQALPIMKSALSKGEIIRTTGDPDDLREIDRLIAEKRVLDSGQTANFDMAVQAEMINLQNLGKDRYLEIDEDIALDDYDVEVYVTNEEFDSSVVVQNLMSMLNAVPEYREQIVAQAFDLMGLNFKPGEQAPTGVMGQLGQNETANKPANNQVNNILRANQPQYATA